MLIKANVGSKAEFDYFMDLDDSDANISDDSATNSTPNNITSDSEIAVFNYRNNSWGAANITASLSVAGDPMDAIAGRVGAYWARQLDITSLAIVTGIVAGNILNDGSDMVNDQSGQGVDISMIIDTKQTAGDAQDGLFGAAIMHSAIRTSLQKQGVVDKIYDDAGNYLYEALTGLRIVINDNVTNVGGVYDTYIVGAGLFAYGEGVPKEPNALDTDQSAGNGAGVEVLYNRKEFSIHPKGFSFTGAMASTSPSNAEFKAPDAYTRVQDRKRIKLAVLQSLA
jgi:hypothetical protein